MRCEHGAPQFGALRRAGRINTGFAGRLDFLERLVVFFLCNAVSVLGGFPDGLCQLVADAGGQVVPEAFVGDNRIA